MVVCAAMGSAELLRPLGLRLPLPRARLLDHRAAAPEDSAAGAWRRVPR